MKPLRLLAPLALLLTIGVRAAQDPPFENEIRAYEAQDAKAPPKKGGIVFVGSSSIRMWKTLKEDFPKHNVINRGFGGSQVSDSVRYVHRIVTPYKPKMVVFFAGTNDIAAGKTAETVAADFARFTQEVKSKLPMCRIVFISLSPAPSRWAKMDEFKKTNDLIKKYCIGQENMAFADVFPLMLKEGGPWPEIFISDQLHMNEKGYAIWRKVILPYLPWK